MPINALLNSLPRLQTASAPPSPTSPSSPPHSNSHTRRTHRPPQNPSTTTAMPRAPTRTLPTHPVALGALARAWQKSYASDYLVLLGLLTLEILIHLLHVEPFHRLFHTDDLRIAFPHAARERVPPLWLLVYAALVPLGVLGAWALVVRPPAHKAHVTFLGLLLALLLAAVATEVVKNAVGRPRPDLLDRCRPRPGLAPHTLYAADVCTQLDHHTLHDGWRSFPSGHSSLAFAGLGYLALFLAAQLRALRPATPLPLAILPLLPLAAALLIAISRTEDYRHDVWDVTAGSILGALFALAAYRRYYPSLWARRADEPAANRGDTALAGAGYARPKDEESAVGHVIGGAESEDGGDEEEEGSSGARR